MYYLFWLTLALILLLLEGLQPGAFFFLSFAVGAGLTTPLAWWQLSPELQCFVMFTSSFITLLLLKQWADRIKLAGTHKNSALTNVDALVGQKIVINQLIKSHEQVFLTVAGDIWSCKNIGKDLQHNDVAIIVRIEGNRLLISKI